MSSQAGSYDENLIESSGPSGDGPSGLRDQLRQSNLIQKLKLYLRPHAIPVWIEMHIIWDVEGLRWIRSETTIKFFHGIEEWNVLLSAHLGDVFHGLKRPLSLQLLEVRNGRYDNFNAPSFDELNRPSQYVHTPFNIPLGLRRAFGAAPRKRLGGYVLT